MKIRPLLVLIMILLLIIALYGCGTTEYPNEDSNNFEAELQEKEDIINKLKEEKDTLLDENDILLEEINSLQNQLQSQPSSSLLVTAFNVIDLLEDQDMNSLSSFIHPNKGVRFTPYAYIDLQEDLFFTSQQISGLLQSSQVYNWGNYDGTGDPIDLSFSDYYNLFIYDVDFANPHMIGNNVMIGTGNSINNIGQTYPNGEFVEFHFTGFDPGLFEMDWKSLRLVFEEFNGAWYLVGIVHDQWTI